LVPRIPRGLIKKAVFVLVVRNINAAARSSRSNRSTAALTNYCGPFQTFQTFNRYAPFNAFGGSKVQ